MRSFPGLSKLCDYFLVSAKLRVLFLKFGVDNHHIMSRAPVNKKLAIKNSARGLATQIRMKGVEQMSPTYVLLLYS
eukprot:6081631-Prorocentrum_lima.AAC.1